MSDSPAVIRLDDLPPDPAAHDGDPGCDWHPRPDKAEARGDSGHLADLDDAQVLDHMQKPEADEQYDGWRRRTREDRKLGAAEDSAHSPDGQV